MFLKLYPVPLLAILGLSLGYTERKITNAGKKKIGKKNFQPGFDDCRISKVQSSSQLCPGVTKGNFRRDFHL